MTIQRAPWLARAALLLPLMALCGPGLGAVPPSPSDRPVEGPPSPSDRPGDDLFADRPQLPPTTPPRIVSVSPPPPRRITDSVGLGSFTITFDQPVVVPYGAVRAWGVRSGALQPDELAFDPATLTLTGRLAGGRLADFITLEVDYTVRSPSGAFLDGECGSPRQPSLPTGDGVPGGRAVFRYAVLQGDADGSGLVDEADRDIVLASMGRPAGDPNFDPRADLNRDNIVDAVDLTIWVLGYGDSLPQGAEEPLLVTGVTPGPRLTADLSGVVVTLSGPVSPQRIDAGSLFITSGGGFVARASAAGLSADGRTVTYALGRPLPACAAYTFNLAPSLARPEGGLLSLPAAAPAATGLWVPAAVALDPFPASTAQEFLTLSGAADEGAVVTVVGPFAPQTVPVTGGRFSVEVQLATDRVNSLSLQARSPCGVHGPAAVVQITRDTSPPLIQIDSPRPQQELYEPLVTVAGRVSDEFSAAMGLTVTVNGRSAAVTLTSGSGGTFLAEGVPLTAGTQQITVTAADALHNSETRTVTVTRLDPPADAPVLRRVGGDGQSAPLLSVLQEPVAVQVLRADGQPMASKLVTFTVGRNDGQLAATADMAGATYASFQVFTDAAGHARAYWRLGHSAGAGSDRVRVSSTGIVGELEFTATARAAAARRIYVAEINNQRAETGAPVPVPLRAFVSDGEGGNAVAGVPVTFTVTRGGGVFPSGQSTVTVPTDARGRAETPFRLGALAGSNTVEASFEGMEGLPAVFESLGLARTPGALTTMSGLVLDNVGRPIGGALCTLTLPVQFADGPRPWTLGPKTTDAQGRFEFTRADLPGNALNTDLPGGAAKLLASGVYATSLGGEPLTGTWNFPYVAYEFVMVEGAANTLPDPIWLPQMNPANSAVYDGTQDVVLRVQGIDGLEFRVRAGSVTRDNGSRPSPADPEVLRLEQVQFDAVPMPLPSGNAFPFAWTLQPKNARFDPPIEVRLPNMTGLPPGSVGTLLQWNNDLAEFQPMGEGRVSADGAYITSEPGSGITVAGWGGFAPPPPPSGDGCKPSDVPECESPCEGDADPCCEPTVCTRWERWMQEPCECVPIVCGYYEYELLLVIDPLQLSFALALSAEATVQAELAYLAGVIQFDEIATYRHISWQATLAQFPWIGHSGQEVARLLGDAHEMNETSRGWGSYDMVKGLHNNELGRRLAAAYPELSPNELARRALAGEFPEFPPPVVNANSQPAGPPRGFIPPPQNCDWRRPPGSVGPRGVEGFQRVHLMPDVMLATPGVASRFELSLREADGTMRPMPAGAVVTAFADDHRVRVFPDGTVVADARAIATFIVETNGEYYFGSAPVFVVGAEDSDGDSLPNEYETSYGGDPADPFDAGVDVDGDGLGADTEFLLGTNPLDTDTDTDGRTDGQEISVFVTDPLVPDCYFPPGSIVSVAGRSAVVADNGSFRITGIPAGPDPVRIRGVGTLNGAPSYSASTYFDVEVNGAAQLSIEACSSTPIPAPVSLVAGAGTLLLTPDQQSQLLLQGQMSDGTLADLTTRAAGTSYRTSNPAIASVNQYGLVTAGSLGTAFITASNEGVTTVRRVDIAASVAETALVGIVVDPDGRPVNGATVNVLLFGGSATTGPDGSFTIPVAVPADGGTRLTAVARARIENQDYARAVSGLVPVIGGTTDAGVMTLRRLCDPQWAADLFCRMGTDQGVSAAVVWDDGTGEALYVGGGFSVAGCTLASSIARWDGARWTSLGTGMNSGVQALAVFDDGSGPALYAGGNFTTAGGVPANRIARWDGVAWTALGSGMNGQVEALAVYDAGSGPALYASGSFTSAGGVAASRVARWNGTSWSALGSGMNDRAVALAVFDDGTGSALYAGGLFTTAGGVAASRIARWNGSSWTPVGTGTGANWVGALAVFDDGTGPALYAGGGFNTAGGVPANCIARWDGTSWEPVGTGMNNVVRVLAVVNDGTGPALYAGGDFTTAGGAAAQHVARWDGTGWAALGAGVNSNVLALAVFDDGSGPLLYCGGNFAIAGEVSAERIARWNGTSWSSLVTGVNGQVDALAVYDHGTGPALYAGGVFTDAGGVPGTSRIARWNGSFWSPLVNGVNREVDALAVYDDGMGPSLYAGGGFTAAGGVAANRIARWNGSSWSSLGSGMNSSVTALAVYDDGTGPALYAGGVFDAAGGAPGTSRIARWNGTAWLPLGTGVNSTVFALAVYDDGTGPALYAGGVFTAAGGVPGTSRIARWNGSSWSSLGTGVNGQVSALAVYDDGTGPALYAGGGFGAAGGVAASRIARWNGSSWSPLGTGVNNAVTAIAVYDDGTGAALYAGGLFTAAGGVPGTSRIARWNGTAWSSLGTGVNGQVSALAVYENGTGPALYAGGNFTTAGNVTSAFMAKWYRSDECGRSRSDGGRAGDPGRPPSEPKSVDPKRVTESPRPGSTNQSSSLRRPDDGQSRLGRGAARVPAIRLVLNGPSFQTSVEGQLELLTGNDPALNSRGQRAVTVPGEAGSTRAFRADPGSPPLDLGTFGGPASGALAINERGDVAGWSDLLEGGRRAFVYLDATGERLVMDDRSGWTSRVTVLRDGPVAFGTRSSSDGDFARAFVWVPPSPPTDLSELLGLDGVVTITGVTAARDGRIRGTASIGGREVPFSARLTVTAAPPEDLDASGLVDAADVAVMVQAMQMGDDSLDLTGDGAVDVHDLRRVLERRGARPRVLFGEGAAP